MDVADRRHPGAGLEALLRPERLRGRRERRDLEGAHHRHLASAPGPRHLGTVPARLHLQGDRRGRRAPGARDHDRGPRLLPRPLHARTPHLPLLEEGGTRGDVAARRARAVLRRLLLPGRAQARHRSPGLLRARLQPGPPHRDPAAGREVRPGADGGLEADALRRAVGGGRDGLGVDRSGLQSGHAAAARGRLRGDRQRRTRGAAAPDAEPRRTPTARSFRLPRRRSAARCPSPRRTSRWCATRSPAWSRSRAAPAGARASPGCASRARPAPRRSCTSSTPRISRRTRCPSSTATTPGSWPSRRPRRRRSWWRC